MWRLWGNGSANISLRQQEKSYQIKVNSSDGRKFQLNFGDEIFLVENVFSGKKNISFEVNQRLVSFAFQAKDKILNLYREGIKFAFENITNIYQSNEVDVQEREIVAPITGSIAKILVKNGQVVSKDEAVVFIEAMKMEYKLVALKSGKILGLKNKKGDLIEKGETLLEIE
jgi:Acetyl/propionyl-CoA carboxylase, alpha subunit